MSSDAVARQHAARAAGAARDRRYQVDVRSAGVVMIATIASRASGFVREVVLAALFGATRHTDAFFTALRIHGLAASFGAQGLGRVAVPLYTGYLARGETDESERFLGALIGALAALLFAVSAALVLLAPAVVSLAAPGFSPRDRDLAILLTRILAAPFLLLGLTQVLSSVLEARRRFLLAAVAPLFYNAGYIAVLVMLGPALGMIAAAAGLVVGCAASLAAVGAAVLRGGVSIRPRWEPFHAAVRKAVVLYRPVVLSLLVLDVWSIVEAAMASHLPAGSLSYLNYGYRVAQVPIAMFVDSVATVVFPSLAALAATRDLGGVRASTATGLRMTLFLTVPAAVVLGVLARPLIGVALQRGAFGAAAAASTALALQMYAVGLCGAATISLASRAFNALHDTRTPALLDAAGVALAIAASVVLVGPLRHGGLALGWSIGMTAQAAAMVVILGRRVGSLWHAGVGALLGRLTVAAAATGVCAYGAWLAAAPAGRLPALALAGVAAAAAFVAASRLLGIEEVGIAMRVLRAAPAEDL